jgi:DNA invertase Pin-like site-specific DNA recombinase
VTATTSPARTLILTIMAGVFAQLERAMIRLRQREGIEAAQKAGKYRGGKKRFDPATIRQMSAAGMRPHQIKAELGCSFDTITRALRQGTRPGMAAP